MTHLQLKMVMSHITYTNSYNWRNLQTPKKGKKLTLLMGPKRQGNCMLFIFLWSKTNITCNHYKCGKLLWSYVTQFDNLATCNCFRILKPRWGFSSLLLPSGCMALALERASLHSSSRKLFKKSNSKRPQPEGSLSFHRVVCSAWELLNAPI